MAQNPFAVQRGKLSGDPSRLGGRYDIAGLTPPYSTARLRQRLTAVLRSQHLFVSGITPMMPGTALLIAGLIFPTLSLVTCLASLVTRWRHHRHASPVFIPFVGPALLTDWVLMAGHSRWLIPVVWLFDLGTVAFLFVLPRLTIEWWRLSAFTRLMTLHGSQGIEKVILTLHRGGHYFVRKSWNRAKGELGILDLGETGTFIDDGEVVKLTAHSGQNRRLQRVDLNTYEVSESDDIRLELRDRSLHGWRLDC
jgi:hypothetical protein